MKLPTQPPDNQPSEAAESNQASHTQPAPGTLRLEAEAVEWLQVRASSLELPMGYLAESRRRLVRRLARDARRSWWVRLWAVPRFRLAAHAVSFSLLALALVAFLSVLLPAARVALPGEPLHAVKLGIEQARLGMSFNDEARANLHVRFAGERSNELQALMIEGEYNLVEIASWRMLHEVETARRYLARADDLSQSQRQILAQELHQTLMMQSLVLRALVNSTPAASQPVVQHILFLVR